MDSEYIEYTIKIKDENYTLSEKDIHYGSLLLSRCDDFLIEKIHAVMEKFPKDSLDQGGPEITITVKMVWQS